MTRSIFALTTLIAAFTLLSGCIIHVGAVDFDGQNISKVFGNISVQEHRVVENLDTVNGNINLDDHVTAHNVDSVNGNVDLGDHVKVDSIDVVNGNIDIGSHLTASGDIETVNGDITAQSNAIIDGSVETVNGDIALDNAKIDENVETVNGDITIKGKSHIAGDIVMGESTNNDWHKKQEPTLTLGEDVTITGRIILKRPVKLKLGNASLYDAVENHFDGQ